MKLRQAACATMTRRPTAQRLLRDYRYRTVTAASVSFGCNLAYAVYHGVLGLMNLSLWYLTMCGYYMILSTMRFSSVLCARRGNSVQQEYFVMQLAGGLLILLSLILSGVIYMSIAQNIATKHNEIVMIIIATYTFYKLTLAIIKAVRQRHNASPVLAVIRGIGYAEVAASVLTLQRSMLISFGEMEPAKIRLMNALTGAAVCCFICSLGIVLIVKTRKKGV